MKADPTKTLEQFQQAYHWGGRGRRGLGAGLRLIGRVIPRRLRLKILSAKCATVDRGGHA